MTFAEFLDSWVHGLALALEQDQRPGQYAMNLLWDVRPDLYNFVTGWFGVDCFYRDDCLPRFWEEVAAKW